MKKVDKIVEKANMFEKLAMCETKGAMRKVLAQKSYEDEDSVSREQPVQTEETEATAYNQTFFNADMTKNQTKQTNKTAVQKPIQYSAKAALTTTEKIKQFQQGITNYLARNPTFATTLNSSLGGTPWGKGKGNDVDGILGKRTQIAWEQYQARYTKLDPVQDMKDKQVESETQTHVYDSLNSLRQKIQMLYDQLNKSTRGFTIKTQINPTDVWEKWVNYINPEYASLYSLYNDKKLNSVMNQEFLSLTNFLSRLTNGFTTNPGEMPKSVLR